MCAACDIFWESPVYLLAVGSTVIAVPHSAIDRDLTNIYWHENLLRLLLKLLANSDGKVGSLGAFLQGMWLKVQFQHYQLYFWEAVNEKRWLRLTLHNTHK